LITYTYKGSYLREFVLGDESKKQLHRDIKHDFNFRFKAVNIVALSGKTSAFLITDESEKCYIIRNDDLYLNRFFSLQKICIKTVIPLADKVLAIEYSKR